MEEKLTCRIKGGKKNNKTLQIICPEYLGIGNVQACQKSILNQLSKPSSRIEIDASNIQRSDTCGIQLLYSLIVWARKNQTPLTWQKPSEVFIRSVNLLGLSDAMQLNN